ncbi:PREDICTED: uncharacterized protein LOC105972157 [Erythranthe guttata]|uniref:uncharacterized protein LOC105972157 n=1 Tax=Erythranthe guttata TaxID=4155 RepID=UPI00064DD9E9|nr:PREDICTED: uncharacterized protein LOC105972157 [Erythranthe guttata]|eukprot:XP_012852547.1 PREDICTED: uncharacterized protein LOC105972157 [Erythranthe guttata]
MSIATTSVTTNQGSTANILVKGGVNSITLSNLKASAGNQNKGASTSTPHSMRPPLVKTPPSRTAPSMNAPGSLSALRTRSTPTSNPTRTSTKEDGTSSKTRFDAFSL